MELFVNQDRQASQVNLTNFEYMQNINTSHTMHNSQYPPNTQLSENVQYQNSQYQQNSFPNQNTQYQDNSFPNHTQYQQDPFPYHNSPFFQSLRPSGNYHVSSNAQYTQNIQCSQYIEYPVNEKNTNLNIGSSQNYNKHVDDDEDDDDDQEGGGDDEQEKIGYNSDIDGDDFDEFVDEEGEGFEMNWEKNTFKYMPDPTLDFPNVEPKQNFTKRNDSAKLVFLHRWWPTKKKCIESIGKKAILDGYQYKPKKTNAITYNVVCVDPKCQWSINCGACLDGKGYMIKDELSDINREIRPKDIMKDMSRRHGLNLTYNQAYRSKNKGLEMLMGMDGNNQTLPIAFGICQGEDGAGWTWFLEELKACISQKPNLSIISDRHPAILESVKQVFPNAFHGFCCRHLMMNASIKKKDIKRCIGRLARLTQQRLLMSVWIIFRVQYLRHM
ncbi:transposase, MuDR, MULE transposase domain protein [Tanacetum coccineum]